MATMNRVLLTGMSGTGKSSVIAELRRRGFTAIDMDEPGWSVQDADGHQLWCEERLREALATGGTGSLFVSGCAGNQVKFYPDFSRIVLMSAPVDVIRKRLAMRTENGYGKRPDELADVLRNIEEIEPLLRRIATHEIVTTMPIHRVVDAVLALSSVAEPASWTPAAREGHAFGGHHDGPPRGGGISAFARQNARSASPGKGSRRAISKSADAGAITRAGRCSRDEAVLLAVASVWRAYRARGGR
jgi:hypothetical protein